MNTQKIGVIQALGLGYESVMRAAWVVLIPVVLDLFFWLGPHLTIRSIFDRLIAAIDFSAAAGADIPQNLDDVRAAFSQIGASFNLFSLLATDFMGVRVLPVPSLKAFELTANATGVPLSGSANMIALDSPGLVLAVGLGLLVVGLLIGVAYLALIADRVRFSREQSRPLPARVLQQWVRLLLFVAVVAGIYALASIPFLIVFGIASLINIYLGMLVLIIAWTVSFWLFLYLWFVAYALVIDDIGVLRAVWHSANVVQRNLLSTFGLILLSNIILSGMVLIWQWFEASWFGNIIAIAGNAFIGSGLVAAAFVFYQDRLRAWQAQRAEVGIPSRALR